MKILAMEISSRQGSVALVEDGDVTAEVLWEDVRKSDRNLFTVLPELMDRPEKTLPGIDVFAVGRGPGSYSGLRMALTAARAFALPEGKQVFCVNSGEVLVSELARDSDAAEIAVVGDARRGRVWYRVFRRAENEIIAAQDWALAELEQLDRLLPADALIAGPDWSRLSARVRECVPARRTWVEQDCFPRAGCLGQLVARKMRAGKDSEPLAPIYMHPPVL